jgi:glycosyl-4,4'-diaponeurosporenoate acyltransferase
MRCTEHLPAGTPSAWSLRCRHSSRQRSGAIDRGRSAAMPEYFEPGKFEQWRERSLYEFLGVRFFKRYLLPTELLLFHLRGKKAIQGRRGVLKSQLKRLEWETRRNEVIHLLALLLTGCILVFSSPQLSMGQFIVILAINLYVNVYPIFLQRYNRFRMMRLLGRM